MMCHRFVKIDTTQNIIYLINVLFYSQSFQKDPERGVIGIIFCQFNNSLTLYVA